MTMAASNSLSVWQNLAMAMHTGVQSSSSAAKTSLCLDCIGTRSTSDTSANTMRPAAKQC